MQSWFTSDALIEHCRRHENDPANFRLVRHIMQARHFIQRKMECHDFTHTVMKTPWYPMQAEPLVSWR